eukprot:8638334-Lingulodinium_polyedra.AAC.1
MGQPGGAQGWSQRGSSQPIAQAQRVGSGGQCFLHLPPVIDGVERAPGMARQGVLRAARRVGDVCAAGAG